MPNEDLAFKGSEFFRTFHVDEFAVLDKFEKLLKSNGLRNLDSKDK